MPQKVFFAMILILGAIFVSSLSPIMRPTSAAVGTIYPLEADTTISTGNQGLFINVPPSNASYVKIEKLLQPLPTKYTSGFDITFRGPALDIKFLNEKKEVVDPWETPISVYFNLNDIEQRMWEEYGPDDFAIWYYDESKRVWDICLTRFLPEKDSNHKYDRLACFIMGNGVYVMGLKEIVEYYPADNESTINLGKQGLFISNPQPYVYYVKIEKVEPPLPWQYTKGIDISYRGPALEITFLNANQAVVNPGSTLSSVYFNVSEPEVKMWSEDGIDGIAIWYYNESSEEWRLCNPRYIAERQNNQKYDRLACFVMGNGIYVLGKMEFDPVFPLWFKLQGKELEIQQKRIEHY